VLWRRRKPPARDPKIPEGFISRGGSLAVDPAFEGTPEVPDGFIIVGRNRYLVRNPIGRS